MPFDLKTQLVKLLDRMPGNFSALPGEVFSTGTSSLRGGDLYVLGLNPGFGTAYPTIRDHVVNWSLESYSAFVDQCWQKRCWNTDCFALQGNARCSCQRGTKAHQRAVQRIVERAKPGQDLRLVFATNAIFAQSASAASFKKQTGLSLSQAFDACWPVHQFFLSHIRPKVILSLGYSQDASAFALIGKKAEIVENVECHFVSNRKYPSFKWSEMQINLGYGTPLTALVVGIRHPSYVPDAADTSEFSELIASYINRRANPAVQGTLRDKAAQRP
jgi:hypothetical protein